ncbi:hypothetical protein HORM4_220031 [Vibrio harveyi]|nr:hypothetical protein HORM4_220031 [Vibrio harveyi]
MVYGKIFLLCHNSVLFCHRALSFHLGMSRIGGLIIANQVKLSSFPVSLAELFAVNGDLLHVVDKFSDYLVFFIVRVR